MCDSCSLWARRQRRVESWATVDNLLAEPVENLMAMLVARLCEFDTRQALRIQTEAKHSIPTTILVAVALVRVGDLIEEARERRGDRGASR